MASKNIVVNTFNSKTFNLAYIQCLHRFYFSVQVEKREQAKNDLKGLEETVVCTLTSDELIHHTRQSVCLMLFSPLQL